MHALIKAFEIITVHRVVGGIFHSVFFNRPLGKQHLVAAACIFGGCPDDVERFGRVHDVRMGAGRNI